MANTTGSANIEKVMPLWQLREPDASYTVISHAGHVSNQDNPAEFNAALGDFMTG